MRVALIALLLTGLVVAGFFGYYYFNNRPETKREEDIAVDLRPLDKYTIENLKKTKFSPSNFEIGQVLKDEENFESRLFYFTVGSKKVSGQINIPKAGGAYPIIVMSRGYIEREGFKTGDGTRRSSEEFAKAGFITLAPDFLGFGQSDMPSEVPMEDRFETYTTVLTLLESTVNLNDALKKAGIGAASDPKNVGLWGHSNGGQITLTVLEATGRSYPTVLWAPVTKPFPYSILYYTDDIEDHGKGLRKVVSEFEEKYDSELYSLTNYMNNINAPLSIHQGSADDAVPIGWTNDFVLELQKLAKDVQYFTYPEDDHNFANGNFEVVVARNIEFFNREF